jgi:hypothetical protein
MWTPLIKVEGVRNFKIFMELASLSVQLNEWFKVDLQIIVIYYGMKKIWWQSKLQTTKIFINIPLLTFPTKNLETKI